MDESSHMDKLTSLKITRSGSMMRSTTWGSRGPIACASLGSTANPSRARCMKPQRLSAARPMSYSIAKESTMGHSWGWVQGPDSRVQREPPKTTRSTRTTGMGMWVESLEDHPAEDTRSSNTRIEETGSTTSTTLDLTTDSRTQQVLEWESQVRKSGCMMKTKVEKRSGWETIMDTQRKKRSRIQTLVHEDLREPQDDIQSPRTNEDTSSAPHGPSGPQPDPGADKDPQDVAQDLKTQEDPIDAPQGHVAPSAPLAPLGQPQRTSPPGLWPPWGTPTPVQRTKSQDLLNMPNHKVYWH